MNPKFIYVINYFRKLYKVPNEIEIGYGSTDAKINIRASETSFFDSVDHFKPENIIWKKWGSVNIPFLFDKESTIPIIEFKEEKAYINYDILASAFFFLSGWQEYVYMKDKNDLRFPYRKSLQYHINITQIPVVNYYFDILRKAINEVYNLQVQINIFNDSRFALCLTHDIDTCESGWLEDGLDVLKKGSIINFANILFKKIFKEDIWFNFNEIITIEKKFNATSSFFFLGKKGKVNEKNFKWNKNRQYYFKNADYNIRSPKITNIIQKLSKSNFEVGIHGSIGTSYNTELLIKELENFNFKVKGIRFHNLFFDISKTFDILENVGLLYDTSMGFAEEIGFRNGIVSPFFPYNIKKNRPYSILEIPLIIMDTTFYKYKKSSFDEISNQFKKIMAEVQNFNGVLTILWHNNFFSSYKYSGWKTIYENLLSEGVKRKALLMSGMDVLKAMKDYILNYSRNENNLKN